MTKRRGFTLTEMAIVLGIFGIVLSAIWTAYSYARSSLDASTTARQITTIVNRMQAAAELSPTMFDISTDGGCAGWTTTSCPPQTCGSTFGSPGTCTAPPTCTVGQQGNASTFSGVLNQDLVAMGIIPTNMYTGSPSSPLISSLWGANDVLIADNGSSNSCQANASNVTPGVTLSPGSPGYVSPTFTYTGTFYINYKIVPAAICARLITNQGLPWLAAGLSKICVGAGGTQNCTYGESVSPATASTLNPTNISYWCSGPGTDYVSLSLTFPMTHP